MTINQCQGLIAIIVWSNYSMYFTFFAMDDMRLFIFSDYVIIYIQYKRNVARRLKLLIKAALLGYFLRRADVLLRRPGRRAW